METQVRTPQLVFMQPQRLVVPLFQRRYVWNQESQWEPLWNDVVRVADRMLKHSQVRPQPHFLGAVVLQQIQNVVGLMQTRTIIDGQQRLTTLQLFLDALHAELLSAGALAPSARLEPLVTNAAPFCSKPEDRFKVWPTNRDREAFNAVMGAKPPVDHDTTGYRGERMVEAHRFFSEQIREWLKLNGEDAQNRAVAIETVARELLQMVVIDLAADENAQEIFETLNARGAQLTAADLIKNFIFQRLLEAGTEVEGTYERYWKEFETAFWEVEINVGRLRYPRSSIFLNHLLIARTGQEVVAREVFDRFKRFADHDVDLPMDQLLVQIHNASQVYRQIVTAAEKTVGPVDRLGLFAYRTGVLESEVIKPLLLWLLDPEQSPVPEVQFNKALEVMESWMVRRMLVRATTKNYNLVIAELIGLLRKSSREEVGDVIEKSLSSQTSSSRYWPDDAELRESLQTLLVYRRLGRGRLRFVLEAIEDYLRGFRGQNIGLGGERVARGKYEIEHVMPQKWEANWPLTDGINEDNRNRSIHTIGNLTLLTNKLNVKVSNGPWLGIEGKRGGLEAHDVLMLNRDVLKKAPERWTDQSICERTSELIEIVISIWPVPEGHKSPYIPPEPRRRKKKVRIPDLIAAGALEPGTTLFPRSKRFGDTFATLLADGRLEVEGKAFGSPSDAASAMTGTQTNGWEFFLIDRSARRDLRSVRRDYIERMTVDAEDDETDEDIDAGE
jgi:Protein of unknown function DUF262/Protein of unknown function (DUF1524)/Restriction Enzyme Adenine Methylase Associated